MQQAKSVSNREITYKLPTLISRKRRLIHLAADDNLGKLG